MAGLLDALFDPSLYGGQGGGLLSRLMPSMGAIPQSQGFPSQGAPRFDNAMFDPATFAPSQSNNPISVGNYQMPRLGNPDQFVPQQAMLPTNATPTQGQMPQQPAMAQPDLPPALGGINRLGRMFNPNGLIARMTGNDAQSIAQQNLKAQYDALVPVLGPQKAMLAVMNPKAAELMLTQAFGNKEPPKTVEEFAVRNAWEQRNGTAPRAGGSGTDAAMPTTLAELEKYKLEQKAAEKKATTIAEKQGEAAASLPDTLARAEQTIKQIDELKDHPAKSYRTGMGSILPAVPGFKGVDFDERVAQMKGSAFLDAYKMLRGTGAISEKEGAKAEQAQARLSQAKDQKDFDQALSDLRSVVVAGYERAQKMAGEETIKPYEKQAPQAAKPSTLPQGWSVQVR